MFYGENTGMKNLFFIGDEFYSKSQSMMSSIYEIGTHVRWDWGKVNVELRNGGSITIRPATDAEMLWALKRLND